MKKLVSMLCIVLLVSFTGTAFAEPPEKVEICHNGAIYEGLATEAYEDSFWVSGSFVIEISEKAVEKHIKKHEDVLDFNIGDTVITKVTISDGIIINTQTQLSCAPSDYSPGDYPMYLH